jgi:hypothetical protein
MRFFKRIPATGGVSLAEVGQFLALMKRLSETQLF